MGETTSSAQPISAQAGAGASAPPSGTESQTIGQEVAAALAKLRAALGDQFMWIGVGRTTSGDPLFSCSRVAIGPHGTARGVEDYLVMGDDMAAVIDRAIAEHETVPVDCREARLIKVGAASPDGIAEGDQAATAARPRSAALPGDSPAT